MKSLDCRMSRRDSNKSTITNGSRNSNTRRCTWCFLGSWIKGLDSQIVDSFAGWYSLKQLKRKKYTFASDISKFWAFLWIWAKNEDMQNTIDCLSQMAEAQKLKPKLGENYELGQATEAHIRTIENKGCLGKKYFCFSHWNNDEINYVLYYLRLISLSVTISVATFCFTDGSNEHVPANVALVWTMMSWKLSRKSLRILDSKSGRRLSGKPKLPCLHSSSVSLP